MKNERNGTFSLFLLALFLRMGCSLVTAQTPASIAENWRPFHPADDEFTIETPIELREAGEKDAYSSRRYDGFINGTRLYIFSDPLKHSYQIDTVLRFVRSAGQSLETSKPTKLSFPDQYGYYQNISVLRSGHRVYVAQTVSDKEDDPLAERFIQSFSSAREPVKAVDVTTEPEAVKTEKPGLVLASPVASGSGRGSGNGSGSGDGSGIGSGSGSGSGLGSGRGTGIGAGSNAAQPKPPPGVVTPLKILSKPRPGYTDLARFYDIQGTVILRITLLGNGHIGSVSPTKRLPFGLTEKAIEAARRITFEPRQVNGVGLSVTRQIEYTFSIF
jgi:TonB family protein